MPIQASIAPPEDLRTRFPSGVAIRASLKTAGPREDQSGPSATMFNPCRKDQSSRTCPKREERSGRAVRQVVLRRQKHERLHAPAKSLHSLWHLITTKLRLTGDTDAQADTLTEHAATIKRKAEQLRHVIELLESPIQQIPAYHGDS